MVVWAGSWGDGISTGGSTFKGKPALLPSYAQTWMIKRTEVIGPRSGHSKILIRGSAGELSLIKWS